jgi:hypothetical protein
LQHFRSTQKENGIGMREAYETKRNLVKVAEVRENLHQHVCETQVGMYMYVMYDAHKGISDAKQSRSIVSFLTGSKCSISQLRSSEIH